MKKLFMTLGLAAITLTGMAQEAGDRAIGLTVNYGTEIGSLGWGVKGQYHLTDNLRAEATFTKFAKKDYTSVWDLNANLHYLIENNRGASFYPLIGVAYSHWSIDDDIVKVKHEKNESVHDGSKFGVNIGVGAECYLSESLSINAEGKYQTFKHRNQVVLTAGIAFHF